MTEADIAEARTAYRRDGAAVIRGVLDDAWINRMRIAVDRVIAAPSASSVEYTPHGNSGRYVGDFFVWMRDPDFADFVQHSPLAGLAAALMESRQVRFFYDQLLVKEPLTAEQTPWHQDLPYWPVRGNDILSLWVPLDPVTIETGAVQYARGSHHADQLHAPTAFSNDSGFAAIYAQLGLPPMPDEESIRDSYEIIAWETEPGDVIVHHPLTFHFSAGNLSPHIRRRAIATRYLGDDARWDPRPGTFIEKDSIRTGLLGPIDLRDGDVVTGENFPLCYERPDTAGPV